MNWIILLLIAIGLMAMTRIAMKLGSGKINEFLGIVVMNITAFAFPLPYILYQIYKGNASEVLGFTSEGLFWLGLAGFCVGIADLFLLLIFKFGGRLSIVGPAQLIGTTFLVAVAGALLLNETLSIREIVGICLGIISLSLILIK